MDSDGDRKQNLKSMYYEICSHVLPTWTGISICWESGRFTGGEYPQGVPRATYDEKQCFTSSHHPSLSNLSKMARVQLEALVTPFRRAPRKWYTSIIPRHLACKRISAAGAQP